MSDVTLAVSTDNQRVFSSFFNLICLLSLISSSLAVVCTCYHHCG